MQPLTRGHTVLRRLSNDHVSARNCSSNRHKEPKELSWQWSVKKRPEIMNCKDIDIPKKCPKPSFFPRFRKVYIPADQKSCIKEKPPTSWKQYWSFLLPDQPYKPPIITCRKLQAQRRRCCSDSSCLEDCARVNCCPPPKEWYGQAEIYVIPSSLPPRQEPPQGPEPCAPPPPSQPSCVLALKGECPPPKKKINMDDYAYKKAFGDIQLCDETKEKPRPFEVKHVCFPMLPENNKSLRLSCGYFSEFKEVECPKAIATKSSVPDMPPLICKDQQSDNEDQTESKPNLSEELSVEVKKGVCDKVTFLKPNKPGGNVPECKEMHTLTSRKQDVEIVSTSKQSFHSTSQSRQEPKEGSRQLSADGKTVPYLASSDINQRLTIANACQPSKSAVGLHYMLPKPLSGRVREGLHTPPPAYRSEDAYYNAGSQDIDPELSKLAETTKRNMTYGIPRIPKQEESTTTTLAKELSKLANERSIKRSKEKGIETKIMPPTKTLYPPSKLTLLKKKKNPLILSSQATFMTEATNIKQAKKKTEKGNNNNKENIICGGCAAIKAAEEERKNPSPKCALNCKTRPAGRCRGPQRKLQPGEPEPESPYTKCKQKTHSLCNQPRDIVKKKERPYKMPCEENSTRRGFHSFSASQTCNLNKSGIYKFHSSTCLNDSSANVPTIYDLIKDRGLNKIDNQTPMHTNDWDSHTSDSYGEKNGEESELPDLSKYQPSNDENGIRKMSYPINLWEYPDTKKKLNYNSWTNNESNKMMMGSNKNDVINNNATSMKRKPVLNLPKDSNNGINSPPSKLNMLFSSTSTKSQADSINIHTNNLTNKQSNQVIKFKNLAEFKEKNTSKSKSPEHSFNPESKAALIASATKEITACPITTQNMWEELPNSSIENHSPPAPQETKIWEKQISHTSLKDNLINDSGAHSMFRPGEESKKTLKKTDNDSQCMYYQEKMLQPGPGNLENLNNINESKQD